MLSKIIITQEGGVIQSIIANTSIEYMIIDYDTDGIDDDKLFKLFPEEPSAYIEITDADIDPRFVNENFIKFKQIQKGEINAPTK